MIPLAGRGISSLSAEENGDTVDTVLRMGGVMEFSREELAEARRQIDSTLHMLRETVKTLRARENPERRIQAFELAVCLIEREFASL